MLSSKTRWTIVGLLSASITINLLDRQVLSVLASELRTAFQWSNAQYGYIAVAFNLGMMCGQMPAGALMDRVGTRIGLAFIFVAWSLLTAAHALAGPGTAIDALGRALITWVPGMSTLAAGLAGFILLRFLLGLSQCGNYTAGIKALAGLFPAATRSRAGGFFNAGAQFGSVIAPPIVVFLASQFGWRMAFVIPALAGLLWLIPWFATFPDKQTIGRHFGQAGRRARRRPAPALGARRALCESQGARALPDPHLHRADHDVLLDLAAALPAHSVESGGRGMSFLAVGFFASVPNLIGMCGQRRRRTADRSVRQGDRLGRSRPQARLHLRLPARRAEHDAAVRAERLLAVLLMGLALFGNQWVAATYIGTVGDVVPQQFAGRVNGIAGFGDNGAALLAVLYTGVIVDRYGWTPVFFGAGTLPFLAMASLFLVLRRIEPAVFRAAR